jgi:hypothetical protein
MRSRTYGQTPAHAEPKQPPSALSAVFADEASFDVQAPLPQPA